MRHDKGGRGAGARVGGGSGIERKYNVVYAKSKGVWKCGPSFLMVYIFPRTPLSFVLYGTIVTTLYKSLSEQNNGT